MRKTTSAEGKQRVIAALICRSIGLLSGITGIVIHTFVNHFFQSGFMVKHNLAYFTLQTNLFTSIIFAVLIVKTFRQRKQNGCWSMAQIHHSLHLACTVYITLTMLGFWLILAPLTGINTHPFVLCDTLFLHTITPLLAILDFVLFASHGGLKKREVLKWMSYPLAYLVSVFIIAKVIQEPYYTFQLGGNVIQLMYPYPFLDPQVMGTGGTAGVILILVLVFLLMGVLYIRIDHKLAKRDIRRNIP